MFILPAELVFRLRPPPHLRGCPPQLHLRPPPPTPSPIWMTMISLGFSISRRSPLKGRSLSMSGSELLTHTNSSPMSSCFIFLRFVVILHFYRNKSVVHDFSWNILNIIYFCDYRSLTYHCLYFFF